MIGVNEMTKQFSNYSDLLTFTRASKGHALRPVSYGDELVTNGDFATDSDWTKDANWTIASGVATATTAPGGIQQNITCEVGKLYFVSIDITSAFSGGVFGLLQIRNSSNTASIEDISINDGEIGTKYFAFVATETTHITRVYVQGNAGSVDNISVKEVTFDQPDGTLTLFEHPNNVPRVEYDADGNRLGLLVEEQRTNLERYSNFSSDWTSLDSTEVQNAVAPDGTETAFTVTRDSTSYGGFFFYNAGTNISVTSGSTYSVSIYLKQGEMGSVSSFSLKPDNSGVGGTVVSGSVVITPQADGSFSLSDDFDASSQNVGNGWYRISFSFTATATGTAQYGLVSAGSSNFPINSSVLVWGAQFEAGSFPTSYIKTTGSTATRSADVASIPVADFGYNTKVGSVVSEYLPIKVTSDVSAVFEISSDSTDDRAYHSASTGNHWLVRSGNAVSAKIDVGTVAEGANKVSGVYKKDDFAISLNGASVSTDTSGNVPTSITEINMGSLYNGYYLNGHIKSIKYYPRRLSNAQLVELTS
jgi:hypothetical protein